VLGRASRFLEYFFVLYYPADVSFQDHDMVERDIIRGRIAFQIPQGVLAKIAPLEPRIVCVGGGGVARVGIIFLLHCLLLE
jgi:hypothetical protein